MQVYFSVCVCFLCPLCVWCHYQMWTVFCGWFLLCLLSSRALRTDFLLTLRHPAPRIPVLLAWAPLDPPTIMPTPPCTSSSSGHRSKDNTKSSSTSRDSCGRSLCHLSSWVWPLTPQQVKKMRIWRSWRLRSPNWTLSWRKREAWTEPANQALRPGNLHQDLFFILWFIYLLVTLYNMSPLVNALSFKGIFHAKMKIVIIYSTFCCSSPIRLWLIFETNVQILHWMSN